MIDYRPVLECSGENKKGPTASAVGPFFYSYSYYLLLLEVLREPHTYSPRSSTNTVVLSSTGSCSTLAR